jgi:hypothetical protein
MAQIPQPILDALQSVVDDKAAQADLHAATLKAQQDLAVAQNGVDQANTAEAAGGQKIDQDKQHFNDLFNSFLAGGQ